MSSISNNTLESYIPPPDLLSPPPAGSHLLKPFSAHHLPEPCYASLIHPAHDLQDPSTCLAIASVRNLPIRLFSTVYNPQSYQDTDEKARGAVLASYPFVSATTEAYIALHSLEFGSDSNWLYAGAENAVAAFDLSRSGEGPADVMRIRKGRNRRGGQNLLETLDAVQNMKGIVSALAVSSDGRLAGGTFGRWVGLYDGFDPGGCVAAFSLADEVEGGGVTQVRWSPCGRYLVVVERNSDGMGIWDIRGTGKRLAWLKGRAARSQQRLGVEVFGNDVWAGGLDGKIRLWSELGTKEGDVEPTWEVQAHEDAVSGISMHPCGSVLATSSGQRHFSWADEKDAFEESSSDSGVEVDTILSPKIDASRDSTIKIWTI